MAISRFGFCLVVFFVFVILVFVLFSDNILKQRLDERTGSLNFANKKSGSNVLKIENDLDLNLNELDSETLKFLLHGILTAKRDLCKNYTIFGRTNADGGYDICVSGDLKPDPKSCKVLSFGINNEWSFDEGVANYGCYVHSYDPSLNLDDHMHAKNIQFHNIGLGKKNEINEKGWKMKNIKTAIMDANLTNEVIDVIKCDAEGAEWAFLEDVIENLFKVTQIILEVHSPKLNPHPVTKEDLIYTIKLFILLQRNGFVVNHSYHKYWCCTAFSPMFPSELTEKCCHEVYLYNTRYVQ